MPYRQSAVIARNEFTGTLRGLGLDRSDRLYVAGDAAVKVFDREGRLLRGWRTSAPGWSIAVDPEGRVFVGQEGQIEIFDANGRLANTWRHAKRLGRVTSVGFVNGEFLAGDAAGRVIRRFDRDGTFLNDIGADNRMQGFLIPNGVVEFGVDDSGVIHATNPGKHRIERYTPDGRLQGHIGRFDGIDPAGFGGCCNPTNVAVAHGRVFVTEKADPRAKVYAMDGRLEAVIAADAFDLNCKNMDIAVDGAGRVYVADTTRLQVLAFDPHEEVR